MLKRIESEPRTRLISFVEVEKAYHHFPLGAHNTLLRNGYEIYEPDGITRHPRHFPEFVESRDVDRHLKHIASLFDDPRWKGRESGFDKAQITKVREELGIPETTGVPPTMTVGESFDSNFGPNLYRRMTEE